MDVVERQVTPDLASMLMRAQEIIQEQEAVGSLRLMAQAHAPATIDTLPSHIHVRVSLELLELRRTGGPTSDELLHVLDPVSFIETHGDSILTDHDKMAVMCRAIAVRSYAPGGVSLFGFKWEVT